jgi:hypothetical protein
MVPDLRRIVEQRGFSPSLRPSNDVDERAARIRAVGQQGIDLVDISPVVLAVVEVERLGRHEIAERIASVRKWGQFESHLSSPQMFGFHGEGCAGPGRGMPGRHSCPPLQMNGPCFVSPEGTGRPDFGLGSG